MSRIPLPAALAVLLDAALILLDKSEAAAVLMLSEAEFDFSEIHRRLAKAELLIASHVTEVQEVAREDGLQVIPLSSEPQSRYMQVTQALLDAISDEILQIGDRVVAIYSGFDRDAIDSISVVDLGEHLARLTVRDLQRLETNIPLPTLRRVVDLAVEIGREGREGKKVGTIFVVGQHRKVLQLSHEQVHDPFRGYSKKDRMISNSRVRESIKELAQIDGAFVISADGCVVAAGRILDASADELKLSKGLGSRHWAAAGISKATKAIAITVSESTGTVRIFQNGVVVLRIEPMMHAMKWQAVDADPPEPRGKDQDLPDHSVSS
jgi:DNA integrity scanning protein DisA with diadenylate cyclase activity